MRTWIFSLGLCSALCTAMTFAPVSYASEARETPQVRAVARAKAAVVNIHTERLARDRDAGLDGTSGRKVNGMGTGIIIDQRGYIVTNQHVIADTMSRRVTLSDGSTYMADIVSYDRIHDLAIIKIEASRTLPVIPLGTSCDVMLCETVLAVGNPFGYEHTVTQGIVSALSRDVEVNEHQSYKNLLQTDASINPGNSGGPLLNLDGEVIGINVAIRAGAQRIGFAIPIDDARKYIANLLDTRQIKPYTFHGLVAHDVKTPEHRKLVVDAAEQNSPAAAAGFLPGDVVTQVGSVSVVDRADFQRTLLGQSAGTPVEVTVKRNQETVTLNLQLASAAAPAQATVASKASGPDIRPRPTTAVDTFAGRSWKILGLKLDKASPTLLEPFRNRYRGGMKVVEVRPDSPASRHGIVRGDVLVGLHVWETIKPEDINYVLNQTKLVSGEEPLKFYIVRGSDVLFGNIQFATPTADARR